MRLPFKGLYKLSQEFGVNAEHYSQFKVKFPDGSIRPMAGHNGLDFACPSRTEIVSPHEGEILEATLDLKGYGWYVKIENDKEGSVLAHLDTIDVQVGYKLKEGEHLGWSDNTGNSSAPHLHWGYYLKPRDRSNGLAGFIDQTPFLVALGYVIKLFELPVKNEIGEAGQGGQLYTKEQYDSCMTDREKFWGERDEAISTLTVVQKELADVKSVYSSFQAMGYNTIDDITKALNQKDEDVVGVKQQLVTALSRNKTLADLLSQKDHEDSTAIEDGLKALTELKQLKNDFATITKVSGSGKPDVTAIISKVSFFKDLAEKFIKKTDEEQAAKEEAKNDKVPMIQKSLAQTFLAVFGL